MNLRIGITFTPEEASRLDKAYRLAVFNGEDRSRNYWLKEMIMERINNEA